MKKSILVIAALAVLTLTSCREEVAVEATEETVTEEAHPVLEVDSVDVEEVEVDSVDVE